MNDNLRDDLIGIDDSIINVDHVNDHLNSKQGVTQKLNWIHHEMDWLKPYIWWDDHFILKFICMVIIIVFVAIILAYLCSKLFDTIKFKIVHISVFIIVFFIFIMSIMIVLTITRVDWFTHRMYANEYQYVLEQEKDIILDHSEQQHMKEKRKHNKDISGDIYHDVKPHIYEIEDVKPNNDDLYLKTNGKWYEYSAMTSSIDDGNKSELNYAVLANAKQFKGFINDKDNTVDIQKLYEK